MHVPLTPLDFLERARRLFPERVGVVDGDQRWTYGEYAGRCHRLGHALRRDLGVSPGDRVAWLGGNTHHLLEAYYGVLLAGAVLTPLNVRLAPAELRAVLADSGARVLFRHVDQDDPGAAVSEVAVAGPHDRYEDLLAAQPPGPCDPGPVDETAPAELFYTSGSTGTPKGAVLSHRALYLHAVHSALTNGLTGDDVVVHTIPLFHVNGWGTPHYVTALGGVHVMLPRFDPAEVLRLVETHRVTRLFAVPTMVGALLAEPSLGRRDLSSLRQVSIGGAPAGPEMLAAVEERFGCDCICGYGLTETAPTLTRSLDKPGAAPSPATRATTGLPIVGVDARVLAADGAEVPWDGRTVGEICVRSNHVMSGYWRAPQATAEVIRAGWFHTGDLATVDPAGYVTIVDRSKDLIISGGENISSVEVEKAVAAHPAVREVAVVGVPHQRWGEVPRAFVALHEPGAVDGPGLAAHTRERLAAFKVPKEFVILDDLPKGGTGKVQKQLLRQWGAEPAGGAPA